jgi:hypothetical protein
MSRTDGPRANISMRRQLVTNIDGGDKSARGDASQEIASGT